MIGESLSENDLLALIAEADEAGLAEGKEPKTRSFTALLDVLQKINPGGSHVLFGPGAPPIVDRIQEAIKKLYRPEDIQSGGVHLGMYMFRDFFCRVHVPIAFGAPSIDPLNHIDLTEMQKRWLYSTPWEWARFHDQFFDLWDFGYGSMELGHHRPVSESTLSYIGMCRFHLQAASSVLLGAYDHRGATQSALIAVELALKGRLFDAGGTEKEAKQIGHNLAELAKQPGRSGSQFDMERVLKVLRSFPEYVPNRYAAEQPSRIEVGRIVMAAQYIASEVTRQMTNRNIRADNVSIMPRSYPN